MFAAPQPTPYDLNFRLFGFPVRVHPLFWLVMLLMGPRNYDEPNAGIRLAAWLAIGFGSILLHELGHALAFRYYGCPANIWLYWFGGLAGGVERPRGHWPNIIISLAGPLVQLILCGLVYASNQITPWANPLDWTFDIYWYLIFINLAWPLLNLLPVWPLDGGQVLREALFLTRTRQPEQSAMKVSMVTALILAALGAFAALSPPSALDWLPWWVPVPSLFGVLLFGSLAYSAYENLQRLRSYNVTREGPW